ncbi:pyrroloquinoline-quinone synthase PqqC [Actinosynnema sp. NPDC047251]|uniref:Pyrroloquinoline-quinone synthase n=1 Tax=Saccharothrix espanaensis (strain ATCC 51144 / DSM 44229 / JCM 9112 / NBRC 15066 / NRRL 15764) TaxID=1179773 RepID=K0JTH6_SACES|nr:pyrroloquinoline-quinone synthase PqqC [Saccharothrix espanaensis]CCH28094.1 Bifunctional coenzyme PQQ synthesis protein C/D [Saccharothrix espanaensis DSM 44229]
MSEPSTEEEFTARLRALSSRYWDSHPFHLRLHAGELSKDELRLWAANRWYYQRCIPRKDAAILANCPDQDVRRQWRERIVWHDGERAGEGGAENWLRMAEALGLTREEVLDERHVLPGTRFAVDAYVTFARTRPWVEAVASGLTEMFSRGLMTRRLADMRERYPWIAEEGFTYFTTRLKVIEGEGKSTLDLVVRNCRTREHQDAAVAALAFKCDVLRAILDAVDYYAVGGADRTTGRS